ncbi:hypothetical protein J7J13_01910 [bacterium]|nr:hypothetical protein [bacterium]
MSIKNKKRDKVELKERIKKVKLKTKKFWEKYEIKIVMATGIVLVSVISFEAGALKGQNWRQEPLIIEKVAESSMLKIADAQNNDAKSSNSAAENSNTNIAGASDVAKKDCAFVGSKNSNKYHSPDCSYAKRIKPKNIVCFSDEEDAKNKGYVPAGCCVGKK